MINADKPMRWKADVIASVRMYNDWFLEAAPKAYRDTRATVIEQVDDALVRTNDLTVITPVLLKASPSIFPTLRMCTSPPLARDRLMGLAYTTANLVGRLEKGQLPQRM